FYGHADLPRLRDARVTGGIWSITTNPLRRHRARTFRRNLEKLVRIFQSVPSAVHLCRNAADYRAARKGGKHGAFIGIQGGNALDEPGALDSFDSSRLIKVTIVHLSTSTLGMTSAPTGDKGGGLTARGREFVQELDARRIFVDLAHINRRGFFD